MRAFLMCVAVLTLAAAGCGGSDDASGEALIGGDVTFSVGSSYSVLAWGVAVPPSASSTAAFAVIMASRPVDCSTTTSTVKGNYVVFDPTSASPMVYDQMYITVVHTNSNGFHLNGSSGHVEITSISETSVAGSILHMDDDDDGLITVNGTFEVVRCF